jgi:hypothetical protein
MADTPKDTWSNVLDYISCTGAILEKVEKEAAVREDELKKVAELIPVVVEALVKNDRIEPHQKQAATELLKNPLKTLEILAKTAAHRNAEEVARLGTPVPSKNTKYASTNSPYVGARTSEERESDRAFLSKLGIG